MRGLAEDVEFTFALEFEMTLAHYRALLAARGAVGEGVDSAALHGELYAFSVLNVDGGAGGVGEVETAELHRGFIRAFHIERTVGGFA